MSPPALRRRRRSGQATRERAAADALYDFVRRHRRLFVLSGAGVSTDSGIPGYRDAQGLWMRAAPVLLHDFLHSATVRQRYWARSMAGWPLVAGARPNGAHRALAQLEAAGHLAQLVTQNVDGLHQQGWKQTDHRVARQHRLGQLP